MILLNDFKRQWRDVGDDTLAAVAAVGESGWYILGEEVKQFEQQLADMWQRRFAVGVANGLDALEIGLRAVGCKAGDKVLTTPVSAFATTLAILRIGAIPVFADTDESGLIDLQAARQALQGDSQIRFFVPVHLFGHALQLGELAALQREFGLEMVEDCAQSVGAESNGKLTGTVGRVCATSFYPTKNLGAMGDGGALMTSDQECANTARKLRDYGQTAKYQHALIGLNSRLDELQAALLRRVSPERIAHWTARRKQIAEQYKAGISNRAVRIPEPPPGSNGCWHLFPVLVAPEQKGSFMSQLKEQGVATGEHYPIVIPDQPAMRTVPYEIAGSGIERARAFCQAEVSLPIHPYLTDEETTQVINAVNRFQV